MTPVYDGRPSLPPVSSSNQLKKNRLLNRLPSIPKNHGAEISSYGRHPGYHIELSQSPSLNAARRSGTWTMDSNSMPSSRVHGASNEKDESQMSDDASRGGNATRKSSKASVSQVRLNETFINVESLSENDHQLTEAWKRKKRRTPFHPSIRKHMQSAAVQRIKHSLQENILVSMIKNVLNAFVVIFVGIPLTFFGSIMLTLGITVKSVSSWCAQPLFSSCRNCKINYLQAHDAQFFYQGGHQPPIHSLLVIDGTLDIKRIRHIFSTRVVDAKGGLGTNLYPRLSQIVRHLPLGPAWYEDPSFNLHHHIYSGPPVKSSEELQNYIGHLMSQPLNPKKPLWEVIVLHEYTSNNDTVLICRLHQCLSDGISLLRVLCQCLSDNQIPHIPAKPHFGGAMYGMNLFRTFLVGPLIALAWLWCNKKHFNLLTYRNTSKFGLSALLSQKKKVRQSYSGSLKQRADIGIALSRSESDKSLHSTVRSCSITGLSGGPVTGHRFSKNKSNSLLASGTRSFSERNGSSFNSTSSEGGMCSSIIDRKSSTLSYGVPNNAHFSVWWACSIPTNQILRIKQVTRTCVNDIILASLAGAVRISLQRLGVYNPMDMRVNVAVDLRNSCLPFSLPKLGTKASIVPINLPLSVEGAIPRIWSVRESLENMKASADSVVSYCLVWICHKCFPVSIGARLLNKIYSLGSIQYSSLPGPNSPLTIGGYTVKCIYNISPPKDPINVSVTVLSYADRIHLTAAARMHVPNAKWIVKSIIKEMRKQCSSMNETLSHRRLPGEMKRGAPPGTGTGTGTGIGPHSVRSLSELRANLSRVQAELQSLTNLYENEMRKGFQTKSQSQESCSSKASNNGLPHAKSDNFNPKDTKVQRYIKKSVSCGLSPDKNRSKNSFYKKSVSYGNAPTDVGINQIFDNNLGVPCGLHETNFKKDYKASGSSDGKLNKSDSKIYETRGDFDSAKKLTNSFNSESSGKCLVRKSQSVTEPSRSYAFTKNHPSSNRNSISERSEDGVKHDSKPDSRHDSNDGKKLITVDQQEHLGNEVRRLKQEFTELLAEIRRRNSIETASAHQSNQRRNSRQHPKEASRRRRY